MRTNLVFVIVLIVAGCVPAMAVESTDPALAKAHRSLAANCHQMNDKIAGGLLSKTNGGDLTILLCVYAKAASSLKGWDPTGEAECIKTMASFADEFRRRFPDTPVTAAARAC